MTSDYHPHYFNWTTNNSNNIQLIPSGGYISNASASIYTTSYTTSSPDVTVQISPCVYCNHMVEYMATQDIIIGLTERSLERICDTHLTDLYKKIKKGEELDVVFKFPVARIEEEIQKRVINKLDGV